MPLKQQPLGPAAPSLLPGLREAGPEGLLEKSWFTTADAARFLRVHKNTIIAAINQGSILASKTPGGHNRIGREDLAAYMRAHGVPLPSGAEIRSPSKVLVVGEEPATVRSIYHALRKAHHEIFSVASIFEAGAVASRLRPQAVLLGCDPGQPGWGQASVEIRRGHDPKRVAVIGISESGQAPPGSAFDAVIARQEIADDLLNLVTCFRPDALDELISIRIAR